MTELSVSHAARDAAERPAIETASRSLTFATCAAAVAASSPAAPRARSSAASPAPDLAPVVVVATPSIDTVLAVHAAFEARRPIALLHHRLAPGEQDRQRALVERTPLPTDTAAVL